MQFVHMQFVHMQLRNILCTCFASIDVCIYLCVYKYTNSASESITIIISIAIIE